MLIQYQFSGHRESILFSLVDCCSQACNAFGRICVQKPKAKARKSESVKNTDLIYFALA